MTDPADEALASRLARIAAEADPVPTLVLESAFAALSLRRLDAELARMVLDTDSDLGLVDIRTTALGDAVGEVRMLSFEAPGLSISAQISLVDGSRSLMGQVAGAPVTGVSVQTPGDSVPAALDDAGVFRFEDLPSGSLRLVIDTPRGEVVGDWITV